MIDDDAPYDAEKAERLAQRARELTAKFLALPENAPTEERRRLNLESIDAQRAADDEEDKWILANYPDAMINREYY